MKTCRYAFALLLALTATLSAEPPIARVHDCDVIDDRVMRERFGVELAKLVEEGEATDGEELQEQLERGFHELKLPKPSRRSMRQASIYEHVKRSVVLVGSIHKCGNCDKWHANFASGFVVRPDGIIATNYHVLDKKEDKTMGVMTFDGDVYLVREVLAANKTDDTALIQVEAEGLEPLPLRADVAVGSPVSVLSHPNKRLYMFTRGVVSRYFNQRVSGEERCRMAITADYAKGSSGAPVIDDTGAVVGMVASTSSIYYKEEDGQQKNLQMVVKDCVPARSILDLCRPD